MLPKMNDVMMRNSVFLWIALGTGLILLIPLIAMQFTNEVHWDSKDFIIMGFMLLTAATLFVVVSRRVRRVPRVVIGALIAVVLVYVWAELAVGVLTNLGN